jgi:DNA-binding NarL/FixJ family response regulator
MKTKVLIVCDWALVGLGLARVIESDRRFEICAKASDGSAARELFLRFQPQIILLGLAFGEGQSAVLVKEFHKLDPNAGILVLCPREDTEFIERVFRAGASGYLTMQDGVADVLRAIEEICAGHFYASSKLTDWLLKNLVDGRIASVNSELKGLSDRELQVFSLIGRGFGASRLARKLHLSVKTIETHQSHIKEKLGLRSAAELSENASRWMVESARRNLWLRKRMRSKKQNRARPALFSC